MSSHEYFIFSLKLYKTALIHGLRFHLIAVTIIIIFSIITTRFQNFAEIISAIFITVPILSSFLYLGKLISSSKSKDILAKKLNYTTINQYFGTYLLKAISIIFAIAIIYEIFDLCIALINKYAFDMVLSVGFQLLPILGILLNVATFLIILYTSFMLPYIFGKILMTDSIKNVFLSTFNLLNPLIIGKIFNKTVFVLLFFVMLVTTVPNFIFNYILYSVDYPLIVQLISSLMQYFFYILSLSIAGYFAYIITTQTPFSKPPHY